jgi:hypothetical protein
MQIVSRNKLDKFNEICSTFHQESNKIGFAYLWFFYDFLHILQESAKLGTLFEIHFVPRSMELLGSYRNALGLHQGPWKDRGALNWVPEGSWWRSSPESGELVGRDRPGEGGGRAAGPLGSISGLAWDWGAAGMPARRSSAAATAGAAAPEWLRRERDSSCAV